MVYMRKAETKYHIHLVLGAATYEKLRAECERTGATMSVVIRRQIEAIRSEQRKAG